MNKNQKSYNWSLLYINKDLQSKFYTDFKIKFDHYTKYISNKIYQVFSKTTLETANENIPLKSKMNKRVPWENNTISEKRKYFKRMSSVNRIPDTYNI